MTYHITPYHTIDIIPYHTHCHVISVLGGVRLSNQEPCEDISRGRRLSVGSSQVMLPALPLLWVHAYIDG